MRRNAHIQRALLAVLDATDEYRSTYELTLAAYDYPAGHGPQGDFTHSYRRCAVSRCGA